MVRHKYILDESIGLAAEVEVPPHIALGHGVYDDELMVVTK